MPDQRLHSLEELETLGVSLVKEGANKKKFALSKAKKKKIMKEEDPEDEMKAEDSDTYDETMKAVLDLEVPDLEDRLEEAFREDEVSPRGMAAMKAMVRMANGFRDELPDGFMSKIEDIAGLVVDAAEEAAMEEEPKDDMSMGYKKSRASMRGVPAHVKEKLEQLWKDKKDLEDTIRKQREETRRRDYIEKAQRDYKHLPADSTSLGVILKSAYDADESLGKAIEELVKKSNDALRAGNLFREAGSSSSGGEAGSAWDTISKKSKELVSKSAGSMSFAQATDIVIKQEPGLYNEYLAENRAQTGGR